MFNMSMSVFEHIVRGAAVYVFLFRLSILSSLQRGRYLLFHLVY
jgi:hypothetical protein